MGQGEAAPSVAGFDPGPCCLPASAAWNCAGHGWVDAVPPWEQAQRASTDTRLRGRAGPSPAADEDDEPWEVRKGLGTNQGSDWVHIAAPGADLAVPKIKTSENKTCEPTGAPSRRAGMAAPPPRAAALEP